MVKLTKEQKLEIYERRKNGDTVVNLSNTYGINTKNVKYLVKLIDTQGIDILRTDKKRYYSPEFKLDINVNIRMYKSDRFRMHIYSS